MKRVTIPLKLKYFAPIEAEIMQIFDELIYRPMMETLTRNNEYGNAADPLAEAIRSGDLFIDSGVIKGNFNARLSKRIRDLGGKMSKRAGGFVFDPDKIPVEWRFAQAAADQRYKDLAAGMIQTLDNINVESIDLLSDTKEKYTKSIEWMEGDFQRAVQSITIAPTLTQASVDMLASEWALNLDLYIKNWTADNILKLRQDIATNAFAGRRSADLVKTIMDNRKVGKAKATFLARQETSLLMSKYHESRYRDIGSTGYIWDGADDERERQDHRDLNGKQFSWDSPPVTNRRTGARNHPGEDYGCRCVPIALIP